MEEKTYSGQRPDHSKTLRKNPSRKTPTPLIPENTKNTLVSGTRYMIPALKTKPKS